MQHDERVKMFEGLLVLEKAMSWFEHRGLYKSLSLAKKDRESVLLRLGITPEQRDRDIEDQKRWSELFRKHPVQELPTTVHA